MNIEPLSDKWTAFGWEVLECDGNNIDSLIQSFGQFPKPYKPTVILAHTKMGKGVKSIEDDFRWHGRVPTKNELAIFIQELE